MPRTVENDVFWNIPSIPVMVSIPARHRDHTVVAAIPARLRQRRSGRGGFGRHQVINTAAPRARLGFFRHRNVIAPRYVGPMSPGECWFCAAPTGAGDYLRIDMQRDMQETFLLIAVHRRWTATWVDVPRCQRCRIGHGIDRAVLYVLAGSAVVVGLMLLAGATSWAKPWELAIPVVWTLGWLVLWWGVRGHWFSWHRLAPKPERYAREYPAVLDLNADGWK